MEKGFKFKYASEISLWLDGYDDLFSDFDPRKYQEKAISNDFLEELKRAAKDKPFDKIALNLLVPKTKRNLNNETVIKNRLEHHFNHHYELVKEEKKKIIKKGVILACLGLIVLFLLIYFTRDISTDSMLVNYPIGIVEITIWFLFWEGLNMILFETKSVNHNLDFYKKMSKCDVKFHHS
nr:hypothetical protein [Nanoarchaeum sp.]